jgi:hypothetical protein
MRTVARKKTLPIMLSVVNCADSLAMTNSMVPYRINPSRICLADACNLFIFKKRRCNHICVFLRVQCVRYNTNMINSVVFNQHTQSCAAWVLLLLRVGRGALMYRSREDESLDTEQSEMQEMHAQCP